MTNEHFQPLFPDQEQPHQGAPHLSPSEKFALEHPELVDTAPRTREVPDPNARREAQLRGAGGGFADAVAGDITFDSDQTETPVHVTRIVPVIVATPSTRKKRKQPIREPRSGDSERDTGEPLYYGEPQIPTEEEKAIGKAAIQAMRDSGILPSKDGQSSGS